MENFNYQKRKAAGTLVLEKITENPEYDHRLTLKKFDPETGEELAPIKVLINAENLAEETKRLLEQAETFQLILSDILALGKDSELDNALNSIAQDLSENSGFDDF